MYKDSRKPVLWECVHASFVVSTFTWILEDQLCYVKSVYICVRSVIVHVHRCSVGLDDSFFL